ncbi:unnamed protein product, partial [Phaeothamnion confervicola]
LESQPSRWRFTMARGNSQNAVGSADFGAAGGGMNGGGGDGGGLSNTTRSFDGYDGGVSPGPGGGDHSGLFGVGGIADIIGGGGASKALLFPASSWGTDGSFEALLDTRGAVLDPDNDPRSLASVTSAAAVLAEAEAVEPVNFTPSEVEYFLWLGLEEPAEGRWHPAALRVLRGMVRASVPALPLEEQEENGGTGGDGAAGGSGDNWDRRGTDGSATTVPRARAGSDSALPRPGAVNNAATPPSPSQHRPSTLSPPPPPPQQQLTIAGTRVAEAVGTLLAAGGRLPRLLLLEELPRTDAEVVGHVELARLVAAAASPAAPEAARAAVRAAVPTARVLALLRRAVPLQLQAALLELLRCLLVLSPPPLPSPSPLQHRGMQSPLPTQASQVPSVAGWQRGGGGGGGGGGVGVGRPGSAAARLTASGAASAVMALARLSTSPKPSAGPTSTSVTDTPRSPITEPPSIAGGGGSVRVANGAGSSSASGHGVSARGGAIRECMSTDLVDAVAAAVAGMRQMAILCWLEQHPHAAVDVDWQQELMSPRTPATPAVSAASPFAAAAAAPQPPSEAAAAVSRVAVGPIAAMASAVAAATAAAASAAAAVVGDDAPPTPASPAPAATPTSGGAWAGAGVIRPGEVVEVRRLLIYVEEGVLPLALAAAA